MLRLYGLLAAGLRLLPPLGLPPQLGGLAPDLGWMAALLEALGG